MILVKNIESVVLLELASKATTNTSRPLRALVIYVRDFKMKTLDVGPDVLLQKYRQRCG